MSFMHVSLLGLTQEEIDPLPGVYSLLPGYNDRSLTKYMISEKAVYFEGKYLPISRIRNARIQPSFYYPNHSCGKGIPVFKIRLDYGEERPLVLMVERKSSADRIVDKICAANLITSSLITSP